MTWPEYIQGVVNNNPDTSFNNYGFITQIYNPGGKVWFYSLKYSAERDYTRKLLWDRLNAGEAGHYNILALGELNGEINLSSRAKIIWFSHVYAFLRINREK